MLLLLPTGILLGIAALLQFGILPNRILRGTLQFDLVWLSVWIGTIIGVVLLGIFLVFWWSERRVEQARHSELAGQEEGRRRFLRRLDHELKNPLTTIRLGLVNLQQELELTEKQASSMERIDQQVNRLQKLVHDLRRLGELEEHSLDRHPVDLDEILEEAVALACTATEHSQRAVTVQLQQVPWPLGAVYGDKDLLVLVFRNLIENALKFTTAEEKVEVRAAEDEHMLVVEVADTGPGIPAAEQALIFEELYRGENARGVEGSGLGLPLVQRIVALHGGQIAVRSRIGRGTVIVVRLPAAPEMA